MLLSSKNHLQEKYIPRYLWFLDGEWEARVFEDVFHFDDNMRIFPEVGKVLSEDEKS